MRPSRLRAVGGLAHAPPGLAGLAALAVLLVLGSAAGVAGSGLTRTPSTGPAPFSGVPVLDPNHAPFPAATLADYSDLLDPPAGRRGFLFVGRDGHFHFEDGTPGRFWGVNVAKDAVFVPHAEIEQAVAAIARAGFNLVRLHHLDDEGGLLPASLAPTAARLDPRRLDTVDFWIAKLKERGVYVYVDLLDFRTFREEEGVPNGSALGRGAKPYALFNERLVELQRDYARKLLVEHKNPYTGLTWAADPAICLLELCDENGLFHEAGSFVNLVAPYKDELLRRWNFWLLSVYGSREELARVWTDASGTCRLGPTEDPRTSSVGLPGITPQCEESVPRLASRHLFMAQVHREYFGEMMAFLRARGVRCPISAVTEPKVLPDLWASAQELDFIATNYYYDHPYFRPGTGWNLPAFFTNSSPLRVAANASLGPCAASAKVAGKPLVVREWGVCWPNDARGPGMLEALAYACLQQVDAMILFAYEARSDKRKLEYFDVSADPTRWGLAPLCARAFLKGQIAPGRRVVTLTHSRADVFLPNGEWAPTLYHELSRAARLQNRFVETEATSEGDLTVAAGRTAGAAYTGSRALICSDAPATDAYGRGAATAAGRSGYPSPSVVPGPLTLTFGGTVCSAGVTRDTSDTPTFDATQFPPDGPLRAIGASADGKRCLGLRDMARQNYVFGPLSDEDKLRVSLDALGQLCGAPCSHRDLERECYPSDTGQLILDRNAGVLWISAPLCAAVAGELGAAGQVTAGPLAVTTHSPLATCVWQSLDGMPVEQSRRWTLKFVTVAHNTGEQVRVHLQKKERTTYALDGGGTEPVVTGGKPDEIPTSLNLGGRPLISVFMSGGGFELLRDGNKLYLFCDTPGVKVALPGLGSRVPARVLYEPAKTSEEDLSQPFEWPQGAAVIAFDLPK